MPLKKDALRTELRTRLGDPSVAELPDAQIEYALEAALREFSRYRPAFSSLRLLIESQKSEYTLPAGTTGVGEFWVKPRASLFADLRYYEASPTSTWFFDPATLREMGAFSVDDDLFWDWEVQDKESEDETPLPPVLTIFPPPEFGGDAVLKLESLRTWSSLSEKNREAILTYARGEALEYLGRKRSKSVTKIPTAAGQLTLNSGYNERADGRQFKKDFHAMMGGGATVATG